MFDVLNDLWSVITYVIITYMHFAIKAAPLVAAFALGFSWEKIMTWYRTWSHERKINKFLAT